MTDTTAAAPIALQSGEGEALWFLGALLTLKASGETTAGRVTIAERRLAEAGLAGRVAAAEIDFFRDEFPKADLITMGMILHDWNLEHKKMLIAKAYRALPEGGAFVAIENVIDDARRENSFGLLMSLNMLVEFGDAFDFTGADFTSWCLEAGFSRCEILPLAGPCSGRISTRLKPASRHHSR